MKNGNFWKLKVVQKAHKLVLEIYESTANFPKEEKFGLISQMRRCSVSVVANIVESSKRKTLKDKRNFYNIAQGSLEELKYYLVLSYDLKYICIEKSNNLIQVGNEVGAMLNSLSKKLKY